MESVQNDLLEAFRISVDWARLPGPDRRILCAFSGGPDSTALCDLLHRLSGEMRFDLHAAHFNHGIRGRDADEDEEFVRDFCAERDIPVLIEKANAPLNAGEEGISIEMAARAARYAFLGRAAAGTGCGIIALGHNANDRVENLLMRLFRGSGGRGLGSLKLVRSQAGLVFVRPLLGFFRSEILDYLDSRGLAYRLDPTNLDTSSDRGRVRNVLLPGVLEIADELGWHRTLESLARSTDLLAEDEALLQQMADGNSGSVAMDDAGGLHLAIAPLSGLPSPILARIVLSALERLDPAARPERVHVDAIVAMLKGQRRGACTMPEGWDAQIVGDAVMIRKEVPEPGPPEAVEIPIADLPRSCEFGPYTLHIRPTKFDIDRTQTSVGPSHEQVVLALPEGCRSIVIRSPLPGDRMAPSGMEGHTKKLSDIFIDRKLPRRLRTFEPVLLSEPDGDILALPRLKMVAETAKVTRESVSAILVTLQQG